MFGRLPYRLEPSAQATTGKAQFHKQSEEEASSKISFKSTSIKHVTGHSRDAQCHKLVEDHVITQVNQICP